MEDTLRKGINTPVSGAVCQNRLRRIQHDDMVWNVTCGLQCFHLQPDMTVKAIICTCVCLNGLCIKVTIGKHVLRFFMVHLLDVIA